jgi:hypothetical protein
MDVHKLDSGIAFYQHPKLEPKEIPPAPVASPSACALAWWMLNSRKHVVDTSPK